MSDFDSTGVFLSGELCRRFSLAEIQSATHNFDDASVIGEGGFGKVYRGYIEDEDTIVAVKRLNAESKQGAEEFWTEIKALSKLRHTHLVTLIGYSDDCEEMILVYEYMANGTLADLLYKISRKGNGNDVHHLTWDQRLNICIGAARGLDYLHSNTEQSVIHRDVKTTNILLDENWVAKISDFGLSKIGSSSESQTHISTDVKGTFGYLDPEYFLTRRLTKKSDVYAFGVVLFEVLCARPAVDVRVEDEQCSLSLWAQHCIKKGMLDQIIDPFLRGHILPHCLKVFAKVANNCLHNHPKERPTMDEVVGRLELVLASQDNIIPRKEIFTKMFLNIARLVGNGVDLKLSKQKDQGSKNGQSWQLQRDQRSGDNGADLRLSKQKKHGSKNGQSWQLQRDQRGDTDGAEELSFSDLAASTNNFSLENKICAGSFGAVYRNKLGDGREFATKKKLMGLEAFPNSMPANDDEIRKIKCCPEEDPDVMSFSSRLKELPRLSLDSRKGSTKRSASESRSNYLLDDPQQGNGKSSQALNQEQRSNKRPPSVVARLMGLDVEKSTQPF